MNMKKIIVPILVLVLAASAVKLLKTRKAALKKAPVAAVLPVVVDSVTLTRGPVLLTIDAMGVVSSDQSTTLSTRVSGRVLHVYKKEGDAVRKGDLLARIDVSDLEAKKKGIEAKLEGIEYDLKVQREIHARTLKLLEIKGASVEQSRREEAAIANLEKNRDSLRQSVREIEIQQGYATITAPIGGTVAKRLIMVGDLAMPGKPLFRIAAHSGRYINLSIPDTMPIDKIVFKGKKLSLAPKNEAAASGLAQYIAPLPADTRVVEGAFVNVEAVVYDGDNVLVPVDAVLTINGRSFVFENDQGRARKTAVTIVARGKQGLVVTPDLAGRRVLVAKPDILLRAMAGVPVSEAGSLKPEDRGQKTEGRGRNGLSSVGADLRVRPGSGAHGDAGATIRNTGLRGGNNG